MNKELKEQAHKEFDERFGIFWGRKDNCTFGSFDEDPSRIVVIDSREIKSFINSLIDKTVQMTEENFISILDDDSCECDNCRRTRNYFKNPQKEQLRYKNKLEAEIKNERERIAGKRDEIWGLLCEMDTNIKSEKEYADDIISLITNKSNINNLTE